MNKQYVSLMTKINRMFGAVIALTCVALSVFSYQLNYQSQLSDIASQGTALLRTMAQSIHSQLSQVEIITQEMAYDSSLSKLLQNDNITDQILSIAFEVSKDLQRNEVYLYGLSADMVALSANGSMLESYESIVHESRLADNSFYQAFLNSDRLSAWGSVEPAMSISAYTGDVIPYYHKIVTGMNTRIGTVRCAISAQKLFAPLTEYRGEGTLMVLRDRQIIYPSNSDAVLESIRGERWQENGSLYLSAPLDNMNAHLVLQTGLGEIRASALRATAMSLLMICLLGIVLLLVTRQMVKAILARLHRLTDAVGAISQGIYSFTLPEEGPDEVGRLARAFSSLLQRVGDYYNALLQQEKDKRHAQTLALQYQINPHFLFNSLYWLQLQMEEQNMDPALTASIEQLGQVLHYNLLGSREALLSEEEEHILAYVGFVSAMKDTQLKLSIDMPESLRSARILRFTLQPLLENAIHHGIRAGQDLQITIVFSADEALDRFEIAVHNDGRQIAPDRLAELQERLDAAALEGIPEADQSSGHGTAMCNLARRLALTYGDAAQLTVESRENDTCVRILLPLSQCLRKENSRENVDRG